MAGRGDFGEVPEIKNPHCFMLRNGKWVLMAEPINPDRDIFSYYHSGVGLAASFADAYAKTYGEDIGLIPCADGGTKLAEWMPGEILYDHAVLQTRLASRSAEIAGILWHQGESDCLLRQDSEQYHDRFLYMIRSLKRDIGVSGDIPLIIGGLGRFVKSFKNNSGETLRYVEAVNAVLEGLAVEIENCGFAPAADLPCKYDGIHFTSAAYRELGNRYFAAYQRIRSGIEERA